MRATSVQLIMQFIFICSLVIAIQINISTGGWPLINISDGTGWSLNGEQFLQEKLLGSEAFFTLDVYVSPTDRTKNNIYVRFSWT